MIIMMMVSEQLLGYLHIASLTFLLLS